ncbi:MAG: hypothetical protein WEG56_07170 [Chloroflexota bacterium]
MRVSPGELQAVHRAGMLTRYSLFGPVAFVLADLPTGGVAGTGLDQPCLTEHHGIVLRGSFTGHRFSSPDGATLIDHTPIDTIGTGRVIRWRQAAIDQALRSAGVGETAQPRSAPIAAQDAVRPTGSRPARPVLRLRLAPG